MHDPGLQRKGLRYDFKYGLFFLNFRFNEISVFEVSTSELNDVFVNVSIYEIFNHNDEFLFGSFNIGPKKSCINTKESHFWTRFVRRNVIFTHQYVVFSLY